MAKTKTTNFPVIDLFAGAGGLGIASKQAGCDVRLSVEIDKFCCETLRINNSRNHRHNVFEGDVAAVTGMELRELAGLTTTEPFFIVGGPPCQPFSKAAYWTDSGEESRYRRARARGEKVTSPKLELGPRNDDRRDLVREFVRLVHESQASGFVFENVLSILHPRNKGLVSGLLTAFRAYGYKVTLVKANAVQFGVPQQRQRVFIIGHQHEEPVPPLPTHALDENNCLNLKPTVTAGDAISDLDDEKYFEPGEVVSGRWAAHLRDIPPGWNYKWHTAWAGHKDPTFEAETRFWSFLLKLSPAKPSWTIAASPGPWVGPFHWNSRRLRTVELAALQGFPKAYKFAGPRREIVRQIGNAVPPPMASAMIARLLEIETESSKSLQKCQKVHAD